MKRKEKFQQFQTILFWFITLKNYLFLNNLLWDLVFLVVLRQVKRKAL